MLRKQEIFEDIVHILKNDYAGYQEKAALNKPEWYRGNTRYSYPSDSTASNWKSRFTVCFKPSSPTNLKR